MIETAGNPTAISEVDAWEVLDSRGRPTVACAVRLQGGACGVAAVPSGASVGAGEAVELRDGGPRYAGRGVLRAVENARTVLASAVRGIPAEEQAQVDAALRAADSTRDLSRLGANAVLAISVAAALAAADATGVPLHVHAAQRSPSPPLLPLPMVNIVSGGAHAGGAIDIQDVLVVPLSAQSFAGALELAVRVRAATVEVAEADGRSATLVADEGGLGLALPTNRSTLELVCRGMERAGLRPGEDAALAIDVAATQIYKDGRYALAAEGRELDADEWVGELADWARDLPLVSIEDPCAENDWAGWARASTALSGVQLLGDDLFVTSPDLLAEGIARGVGNAILVKPNQNGTLTGARDVVHRAQAAGYASVVSARSGETEDSWLADLAVGWRAGQIKVGSTMRSERTAKWNRLLRIERELAGQAEYAGRSALAGRTPGLVDGPVAGRGEG
ncbi:phosphopyruvate hydratase [Actinopolymorpha alba]|uniref:phosphopyruvate hydratase n=1 Tax=Actinopolymorpha alba TaxID=533267 RepID=UPI00036479CA|nr:phosphopyruvate hydratase [Actinopolymorpha alba]